MTNFKNSCSIYSGESEHPEYTFDRGCTGCALGQGEAVTSAGPDDLLNVKLIVVGEYPSKHDTAHNWPQVPSSLVNFGKNKKLPVSPNGGEFIRTLLEEMFGLCTYSEIWFTNAVHCDPIVGGKLIPISDKIIKQCNRAWGFTEFKLLDEHVPNVPILVLGSKALRMLQLIYGESCPQGALSSKIRAPGLKINEHDLVCVYGPAGYAKSNPRIETKISVGRRSSAVEVVGVEEMSQYIPDLTTHYRNDLAILKECLI